MMKLSLKKATILMLTLILSVPFIMMSQKNDSTIIASIYKNALTNRESYNNLEELCKKAGSRQIGSEASIQAVHILKKQLETKDLNKVYLHEFISTVWYPNSNGKAIVVSKNNDDYSLGVNAFGPSVATPKNGIVANITEVSGIPELESFEKENMTFHRLL